MKVLLFLVLIPVIFVLGVMINSHATEGDKKFSFFLLLFFSGWLLESIASGSRSFANFVGFLVLMAFVIVTLLLFFSKKTKRFEEDGENINVSINSHLKEKNALSGYAGEGNQALRRSISKDEKLKLEQEFKEILDGARDTKEDALKNPESSISVIVHGDNFRAPIKEAKRRLKQGGQTAEQRADDIELLQRFDLPTSDYVEPVVEKICKIEEPLEELFIQPMQKNKIENKMKSCPFCRGDIDAEKRICTQCGTGFSL